MKFEQVCRRSTIKQLELPEFQQQYRKGDASYALCLQSNPRVTGIAV